MIRVLSLLLLVISRGFAQDVEPGQTVLTLDEYLGYVKNYHPLVKQANLLLDESQAQLMKSRGGFDPKLEVDFDRKKFKGTEYYDVLNATFKIPTWYGIEFKGKFEENSGVFLDPSLSVPEDGLYSAGVSVSLARGLLMNKRMAMLKQARIYERQARAERQLAINEVLYNASITYFNWLRRYHEEKVFERFLGNARVRFQGVKMNYELGENPAVDTLEAKITVNNRKLGLEKARIAYIKSTLELSNYLWLSNNIPVEIRENVIPDTETPLLVDEVLNTAEQERNRVDIQNNPKLNALGSKYDMLKVERQLKRNNLLPTVDLEYNFLSGTPESINSFNASNYKAGLQINFPLFLRKERGELKMSDLKVKDTELELFAVRLSLENKLDTLIQEMDSYDQQVLVAQDIVANYTSLVRAEERKFNLGESSLFLVNSRESKLIEAELKAIAVQNHFFKVKASFFQLVNTNSI